MGEYLKAELRREGITLNLVSTAGSGENMELLTNPDSDVSIALVQSGMEDIRRTVELMVRSPRYNGIHGGDISLLVGVSNSDLDRQAASVHP